MENDVEETTTGAEAPVSELTKDDRTWGMFCHLSALAGYVGVPLGWLLGPLVIWLVKRDEMEFVDDQGRESLNFQLTIFLLMLVCIPLMFIVIGIVLAFALAIYEIVYVIIASIKANDGIRYRYPLNFRLIK